MSMASSAAVSASHLCAALYSTWNSIKYVDMFSPLRTELASAYVQVLNGFLITFLLAGCGRDSFFVSWLQLTDSYDTARPEHNNLRRQLRLYCCRIRSNQVSCAMQRVIYKDEKWVVVAARRRPSFTTATRLITCYTTQVAPPRLDCHRILIQRQRIIATIPGIIQLKFTNLYLMYEHITGFRMSIK